MKINILMILKESNNVNNYTKLLIYLNTLNYYKDYYIPNQKLMKFIKTDKRNIMKLLKKAENEKLIKITYSGKKRFFKWLKKEEKINNDLFDYNWLEEN